MQATALYQDYEMYFQQHDFLEAIHRMSQEGRGMSRITDMIEEELAENNLLKSKIE